MLIHIAEASGTPKSTVRLEEMLALHARSRSGTYQITGNPDAAELIVLAGDLETLAEARANQLLRRYPEKTFAYSEIDALIPFAPGVFPSASRPRLFDLKRTQSGPYLSRFGSSNNPEVRQRSTEPKDLLFCFLGRKDCRVRSNLLNHPYNRADVRVLEKTGFMHWKHGIVGRREAQQVYADTIARSHFALCPRGMGFGSVRLFEVMEMGVAPVLLADRYALPPGPDWGSFLLQLPERDFARLPDLLGARRSESEQRGRRARLAWENFFAPDLVFDRLIDQLRSIRQQRILPETLYRRLWPLLQLRVDAKAWLRSTAQSTSAAGNKLRRKNPPQPTSASTD